MIYSATLDFDTCMGCRLVVMYVFVAIKVLIRLHLGDSLFNECSFYGPMLYTCIG
jgi:hypothetical protein